MTAVVPGALAAPLAAAPILVLLGLMVWRGWPADRAGPASAATTLLIAVVWFDLDATSGGPLRAVVGATAEALFIAATIVAILLPALALHRLQEAAGAVDTLRLRLLAVTGDRLVVTIVVGWFFALFVEGAAGFGTPVALAAPLLVGLGVSPLAAMVTTLAGHAAGVSFGAVGTPLLTQLRLVDASATELTRTTAMYHVAIGWMFAFFLVWLVAKELPGRPPRWRWAAFAACSFLLPFLMIAWFIGPELATLGGALVGVTVFLSIARRRARHARTVPSALTAEAPQPGAPSRRPPLSVAVFPYLVLACLIAITRLLTPVRDLLQGIEASWELDGGFSGAVQPLYHPAVLLVGALLGAALTLRPSPGQALTAASGAAKQVARAVTGLVSVLLMARLMSHSAMTDELAVAAGRAGGAWPLLAPSVGALGTFITGSATSSNVLFTEFQQTTAAAGGLDVVPMLAAQGFGAAIGNIVCPHNIVAASATVGLRGAEGPVLRRTGPIAAVALLAGGLLSLALATSAR